MTDYAKKFREGSSSYRAGRAGHLRRDWRNSPNGVEFSEGLRDRRRLKRRASIKGFFEDIIVGIFASIVVVGGIVVSALVAASPVIAILIAVKIIFF